MVKPIKAFLLLFLIILLLSIPSLFVNPEGFRIGRFTLRYPVFSELFSINTMTDSSAAELQPHVLLFNSSIDSIMNLSIMDSMLNESDSLRFLASDTVNQTNIYTPIPDTISINFLRSRTVALEFPDTTQSALTSFFEALHNGSPAKGLLRVLHYGDSQIEGDRVTSYLRKRLQTRFGGRGVGLLHLVPHSYQPGSIRQVSSANWQKFTLAEMRKGVNIESKFGILGGYCTFEKSKGIFTRGGFNEASVTIQRILATSTSGAFTRARFIYGLASEPFMASLSTNGKVLEAEMLAATSGVSQLFFGIPPEIREFTLTLKADESPLCYGISLESRTGIMVDNIALRGSSGTDFSRSSEAFLKQHLNALNAKLIILQFGVNLVPHVVDSYGFYENQLLKQLSMLKRAKPDASIIVIGVSDVSRKHGSKFTSYPNIEKIRDAQRSAALSANVAFWDCYEAMGGQNSMVAWVNSSPSLASKDHIHFSPRGASIIAEMFYSALMNEYERFIKAKFFEEETISTGN
jgi:lysophospholipase L1-like esterase